MIDGTPQSLARYNSQILTTFASESATDDIYCLGTRGWNWEENVPFTTSPPGTYEDALLEFFQHDPGTNTQRSLNILVLVGGVGTGKSTTLARTLKQFTTSPRICSRAAGPTCLAAPIVINLDLRAIKPPVRRRRTSGMGDDQASRFWTTVSAAVNREMPDVFDFATEVRFWRHCSKKTDLPDRSSFVQKWLAGNDRQIRAAHDGTAYAGWTAAQVAQTVERAHTELMRTIPPEDLALYRVYQLAYALDNKVAECKCRYIILDNVDHLDPDVQRTSVDFVEKMASTLRARAAITIRPLTWRRAFDAHVLVRTENHCSPKFADVLTKRLDAMIDTHSLTSNGEAL